MNIVGKALDSPYPNSDRWLTYGPQLTLHGEGQPNREIDSGDWIAYPQAADSRCEAAQLDNTAAGERTPPQVAAGEPGQPLTLRVLPMLFTVELQGSVGSAGGDANIGAAVLFILWIYYTAIVFLLGGVVAETWELRRMQQRQRTILG